MPFTRVCGDTDLESGDMAAFYVDGYEVLVVRDKRGDLHALDGICPHEDFPLVQGVFDGTQITCVNHLWCFDAATGRGVNPPGAHLDRYALKVEADGVFVDPEQEPS
jgi:toluene monooxygenase system ferredoxin subunit